MAAYTPGPWTALESTDEEGESLGLEIHAIAKLKSRKLPIIVAYIPSIGREDFANADLIAAAPDLLAALEFVARDLNTDMPAETAAIVQNAINQAKGE